MSADETAIGISKFFGQRRCGRGDHKGDNQKKFLHWNVSFVLIAQDHLELISMRRIVKRPSDSRCGNWHKLENYAQGTLAEVLQ